jgi:hypothetical protein
LHIDKTDEHRINLARCDSSLQGLECQISGHWCSLPCPAHLTGTWNDHAIPKASSNSPKTRMGRKIRGIQNLLEIVAGEVDDTDS